ncbi:MFS transporter [Dongia mobilis]|uniref:MFS transporter n=1 Tax=Dongia mobilis TaxID=578943 RepID=A0A4R6WRG9_9PROT|nr:organoarsenical effux MFS transporter ArsJ [Dongia mobilis]TDQ84096.1 MFS transporter [Dongia mobilis]
MTAALRNYAIVTAAYWGFTLTDGALRMLVLLHFFRLGYSPLTLSLLFLLYEAAGIIANLIGGWLAVRFGIARMLASGLATQIIGFLFMSALQPEWSALLSVAWVMVAQGICGIAKDVTKTASKSAIKLTSDQAPSAGAERRLFRWVAWFTGSKNAMKGLGFFLGGVLLELLGFRLALWVMAAALALILAGVMLSLPPLMGKAQASRNAREFLAKSRGVNLLAAARVLLFGARDVWFVVGLPVFLYASGWTFAMVGGFLAAWTIGYGIVQAAAPALVRRENGDGRAGIAAARLWSLLLTLVPAAMAVWLVAGEMGTGEPNGETIVIGGLLLFGVAFAINSSVHSYLILAYAGSEKAAEDVGFYYAANAAGRLAGTLLSGVLFGVGGIVACLVGSAAMVAGCWLLTLALPVPVGSPKARPDV